MTKPSKELIRDRLYSEVHNPTRIWGSYSPALPGRQGYRGTTSDISQGGTWTQPRDHAASKTTWNQCRSKAPVSQLVNADDTSVIEIKTATDTSLKAKRNYIFARLCNEK